MLHLFKQGRLDGIMEVSIADHTDKYCYMNFSGLPLLTERNVVSLFLSH